MAVIGLQMAELDVAVPADEGPGREPRDNLVCEAVFAYDAEPARADDLD